MSSNEGNGTALVSSLNLQLLTTPNRHRDGQQVLGSPSREHHTILKVRDTESSESNYAVVIQNGATPGCAYPSVPRQTQNTYPSMNVASYPRMSASEYRTPGTVTHGTASHDYVELYQMGQR